MPSFNSWTERTGARWLTYPEKNAPTRHQPSDPRKRTTFLIFIPVYTLLTPAYPHEAPRGILAAINLNTGDIDWKVPLGEYKELSMKGIPVTGTENYGGSIVTAGGLLFIAATKDEKFRAFDKTTGKLLWETTLPAGGYATPATYMVNGRQYIVVAAGGGKMGTKASDTYVAFALPAGDAGTAQ